MAAGVLATLFTATFAAYAGLTALERRAGARSAMRLLAAYEPGGQAPADPGRALAAAVEHAGRAGLRITPPAVADRVRRRLEIAGYGREETVERYLAAELLLLVAGLVVGGAVTAALHPGGIVAAAIFVLSLGACALAPGAVLQRRIGRRKAEFRSALPDFIDLLTISVEAGLGFEQAVDRIARGMSGVLAEEFRRVLGETLAGSSRAVAMRAMADRVDLPEMRTFVLAVVQADGFGVSIGDVLRAQSEEMRVRWRQEAQEQAQKAPVKILVPLVFCVFPATFVVILGPAAVKVATGI